MSKMFDPGFDITPTRNPLGFSYGEDVFGPPVIHRKLDDIRASLRDPKCVGPETVYAIAMDVGRTIHKQVLMDCHLLFGAVTYACGYLGDEPIRSQGHIHAISPPSGMSTPEVYEIWQGEAIIYMQERATDDPGRCYAVHAGPGDVVIVPPWWAHATVSASVTQSLTFGAWCVREYGYEYSDVRQRKGLTWFPLLKNDTIVWEHNPEYQKSPLIEKEPDSYSWAGLQQGVPIYTQFTNNVERFRFVPEPQYVESVWEEFVP
jgi:glucose-6-phosphate isomerase, archaeal